MLTVYLECQFMIAPPVFANGNMYKNPYKYRYIAESVKCSTKSLSKLSTSIPSAVKAGFMVTMILDIQEMV